VTASVIDTNAIVAANGRDTHVSQQCVRASARALAQIMGEQIVLDDGWRIIREYQRHARSTGEPGPGDAFLKHVLTNRSNPLRCELVHITHRGPSEHDFEEFPEVPELATFDPSDRKFVAVALVSQFDPTIVHASDRGWTRHREALMAHGVRTRNLCPEAACT
jgi:hypothetical protein